jgi:hypothetical protein
LRLKPQNNPPFPPRKPQPYNANEIGNGDGNHGCVVLDVADVSGNHQDCLRLVTSLPVKQLSRIDTDKISQLILQSIDGRNF